MAHEKIVVSWTQLAMVSTLGRWNLPLRGHFQVYRYPGYRDLESVDKGLEEAVALAELTCVRKIYASICFRGGHETMPVPIFEKSPLSPVKVAVILTRPWACMPLKS